MGLVAGREEDGADHEAEEGEEVASGVGAEVEAVSSQGVSFMHGSISVGREKRPFLASEQREDVLNAFERHS